MRCNPEVARARRRQHRRRLAQNKRLFKEFPWLWAIRNYWDLVNDDIYAGTNEVAGWSLDKFLRNPANGGMWAVRKAYGLEHYVVERVKRCDSISVADAIYSSAKENAFTEIVYIVYSSSAITCIFRPEKKGGTFNLYLDAMLHG